MTAKQGIITATLSWLLSFCGFAQTIIFQDNFETGVLNSAWVARPNLGGVNGVVGISNGSAANGQNCVRMGKTSDLGSFTYNALDLRLNLQGKTRVEMTFNIFDNDEETNCGDGVCSDALQFSDNGGVNFRTVLAFDPSNWCNQYGQFPPIDIARLASRAGLTLTANFVIRFVQFDDGDFSGGTIAPDGFFMDDFVVYEPALTYATLPFNDNFEQTKLGNSWAWRFADGVTSQFSSRPSNEVQVVRGIGNGSSNAVSMGKRCDDGEVTNALDLHLNLAGVSQVEMTFDISDIDDETNPQDGLYFSSDGGATFKKAFDFKPELWCRQYGQFPPFDIDELAAKAGVPLTQNFVIRFQQHDDGDFSGGSVASDGFYIDNVSVYQPTLVYANLPFSDNFEVSKLGNSWAWRFADATATPSVNVTRPSNEVRISSGIGSSSNNAVSMGKRCDDGEAANALDLHLNLAGKNQVEMTFDISDIDDETDPQDGLYFSNNGGLTFKKAFDFKPDLWCRQYGQFPPLDIDELAAKAGVPFTDKFVIRFQQYDDGDFSGGNVAPDGFYIDNVSIYEPTWTYASLPFFETFEQTRLGNNWAWRFADATALPAVDVSRPSNEVQVTRGIGSNSNNAVSLGKRCDGGFTTNALDLRVNLFNRGGVELSFEMKDIGEENHPQDGIYLSNNGGISFTKAYSFDFNAIPNGQYLGYRINVDSLRTRLGLTYTSQFVIRFQQHGEGDFSGGTIAPDGIHLDNINVKASTTSTQDKPTENAAMLIFPNPTTDFVTVKYQNTEGGIRRLILTDVLGRAVIKQEVDAPTTVLDLKNLAKGLYWLKMESTAGLFGVQKLVKN
jgi:Secretion system C-terminal sorting domain